MYHITSNTELLINCESELGQHYGSKTISHMESASEDGISSRCLIKTKLAQQSDFTDSTIQLLSFKHLLNAFRIYCFICMD